MLLLRHRFPLTRLLCWLLFLHALVLCYGGQYTYAETPVGNWVQDLLGTQRNWIGFLSVCVWPRRAIFGTRSGTCSSACAGRCCPSCCGAACTTGSCALIRPGRDGYPKGRSGSCPGADLT
ncbi:DUF2238 domain-containing protein [Amycolatopsis nigrescens]|uniref:DUF2238 domain-containing protein n=1 Tax=Amycolatopsis nigrescens TaxID=381445 RepID=UPI003CCC13DF